MQLAVIVVFVVSLSVVTTTTTAATISNKANDISKPEDPAFDKTMGWADDMPQEESMEVYTSTNESPEEERCKKFIGAFVGNKFVGLEVKYDLYKILEEHGGPPGTVNATWIQKKDAPVGNDVDKRPLADAEDWLYKYGDRDGKTYIRNEYAVLRFRGRNKAFLKIRGEIYWTPPDFCGHVRRANYTVDNRGFTFQVSREYCWISSAKHGCEYPPKYCPYSSRVPRYNDGPKCHDTLGDEQLYRVIVALVGGPG